MTAEPIDPRFGQCRDGKYTSTATSVPICVIAVKVAPGSLAEGRNSPAIRRCALEEIGKKLSGPLDDAKNDRLDETHVLKFLREWQVNHPSETRQPVDLGMAQLRSSFFFRASSFLLYARIGNC